MPKDQWRRANLKSKYGGNAYERQQEEFAREAEAQAALITKLQAEREAANRKAKKGRKARRRRRRSSHGTQAPRE